MALWNWSKTANTNATADPTINWAEGMPPSAVNDSARSMMARLAEFRDDSSNAGTTAGSSTAFTLATNQVLSTTPATGTLIAFLSHSLSDFNATLSVDGGTAFPLWDINGQAARPGTLRPNVLYTASFMGSGWLVHHARSVWEVPIGALLDYTSNSLPAGGNFIFPYGQAISRANYSFYYGLVGTTYGAGDGSTTFNVPNLKGRITAALDNMGDGASAGVLNAIGGGTTLGAVGGAQAHTIGQANLPSVTLTGGSGSVSVTGSTTAESGEHTHSGAGTTGGMNRNNPHSHTGYVPSYGPRNVSLSDSSALVSGGGNYNIVINPTDIDHEHAFSFTTTPQSTTHFHGFTGTGTASSVSIPLGGSGTAINDLPPIMTIPKILRII